MRLKLVPSETNIDFMRLRMPALGFSGLLVAVSIALFPLVGLNLGIAFRGGILLEARTTAGAGAFEFARTVSRHKAMQSADYMPRGHGAD